MSNQQIHKRLEEAQVTTILESYLSKEISIEIACNNLGLKRARFFKILKEYRSNPETFSIEYKRESVNRKIDLETEEKIIGELEKEKKLIDDKNIPIKSYNYSAIRDDLKDKFDISISIPTIIDRAKKNGFYKKKPERKIHDRQVLTSFAGELSQHDSSFHLWSPYMDEKLYLITSLDDFTREIIFADLFEKENTWNHILALKSVFLTKGCPLKYYADQHSIFRYVKDRDKNSYWRNFTKFTDDVNPQWKQVLEDCNIGITYALSPQAKGKIERPYRWLQDRVVRIAAKEKITKISELREILKEIVFKYNNQWVHSTTKEIPAVRFENAVASGNSLFKPFKLSKPEQTVDDIFCLRAQRVVDNYRNISLSGVALKVPKGKFRETVDLKIVPDTENGIAKIRFWQGDAFLGSQNVKLDDIKGIVHF